MYSSLGGGPKELYIDIPYMANISVGFLEK